MKQIPISPSYWITDDGLVYSERTNKFLKSSFNNCNYEIINIPSTRGGCHQVGRLILEAWDPRENSVGLEADHIDRNRKNNVLSNLRWTTRSQNNQNRKISKLNVLGIKNVSWDKRQKAYCYNKVIDGVGYKAFNKQLNKCCFEQFIHDRLSKQANKNPPYPQ